MVCLVSKASLVIFREASSAGTQGPSLEAHGSYRGSAPGVCGEQSLHRAVGGRRGGREEEEGGGRVGETDRVWTPGGAAGAAPPLSNRMRPGVTMRSPGQAPQRH